jgi:hypothetical protein
LNAIVIKRNLESSEINDIINQLNDCKIFSDIELPSDLISYSESIYNIDNETKRNLNYQVFKKVIDFGDKIINEKSLSELLTFEKTSIWHYHKFRTYFFVRNLYYELKEINYYSQNFDNVKYYTSNENLKLYSGLPANCQCIYSSKKNKNKLNYISLINYIILIKLKLLFFLFRNYSLHQKKHIIIDHSQKQSCLDLNTLKLVSANYNLHYLLSNIDESYFVINEEVMPKFYGNRSFKLTKSILPHKKNYHEYPAELILLRCLLNNRFRVNQKNYSQNLRDIYKMVGAELNDNDDKLILNFLISLHKSSLYYLFRYSAFKKFFTKYNFQTLTTTDENSPVLKSIIDAAKTNNIITIGMQHGNIHELHPAYLFTSNDKKNKVMTDFTFVWGKYYHEFLADKGNYPPDSLITVGQLRTDIILKLQNSIIQDSKSKIQNSKIVLFASQLHHHPELRYKAAYDVFNAIKNIPEVNLIIKLHPAEVNDFKFYDSIALAAGCSNYQILYDYDLYLLLSRSDLVITCYSTVGSEAVYFRKPLIILDHLKQDIQNYYKNGVAFQATNADVLNKYINDILSGNLRINEKAYNDFIDNYAFKIDGKVADRCLSFIKLLDK